MSDVSPDRIVTRYQVFDSLNGIGLIGEVYSTFEAASSRADDLSAGIYLSYGGLYGVLPISIITPPDGS